MTDPIRVRIVGDHPWAGMTGVVISCEKPAIGILPAMARVRLDDGQNCPHGHECYASRRDLQLMEGANS